MDYNLVKTFPVKRTEPKAFDELPVILMSNFKQFWIRKNHGMMQQAYNKYQKCVEQYDDPDAKYEQYKIIPYSGLRNSAYEKESNAGHTNRAALLRPPPGMKIQHLPEGIREYVSKNSSEFKEYLDEISAETKYYSTISRLVKKETVPDARDRIRRRILQAAENTAPTKQCLKHRIQNTKIRGKKCELNEESENLKGLFDRKLTTYNKKQCYKNCWKRKRKSMQQKSKGFARKWPLMHPKHILYQSLNKYMAHEASPFRSASWQEFFGTHGDDFYKKLNSRSDLALILGPNVAYKPCLLATTPNINLVCPGKSTVCTKHDKKKHKTHNNACLTTLWFSKQAAYKCFAENLQTDHRRQAFSVCTGNNITSSLHKLPAHNLFTSIVGITVLGHVTSGSILGLSDNTRSDELWGYRLASSIPFTLMLENIFDIDPSSAVSSMPGIFYAILLFDAPSVHLSLSFDLYLPSISCPAITRLIWNYGRKRMPLCPRCHVQLEEQLLCNILLEVKWPQDNSKPQICTNTSGEILNIQQPGTDSIRWSRYAYTINEVQPAEKMPSQPLISCYIRCLSQGLSAVWMWVSSSRQELWIFDYAHLDLKDDAILVDKLQKVDSGVWYRSKAEEEKNVTELLFLSLENRMEWVLAASGFKRVGNHFLFHINTLPDKCMHSVSIQFFFHGNCICFYLILHRSNLKMNSQSTKTIRSTDSGNHVYCSSHLIPAQISRISNPDVAVAQRQWKNMFNYDAETISRLTSIHIHGRSHVIPSDVIFLLDIDPHLSSSALLNNLSRRFYMENPEEGMCLNNIMMNHNGLLPISMNGRQGNGGQQIGPLISMAFLHSVSSGISLTSTVHTQWEKNNESSPSNVAPSPSPSPQVNQDPLSSLTDSSDLDGMNGRATKRKGDGISNQASKKQKESNDLSNHFGMEDVVDDFSFDNMNLMPNDLDDWLEKQPTKGAREDMLMEDSYAESNFMKNELTMEDMGMMETSVNNTPAEVNPASTMDGTPTVGYSTPVSVLPQRTESTQSISTPRQEYRLPDGPPETTTMESNGGKAEKEEEKGKKENKSRVWTGLGKEEKVETGDVMGFHCPVGYQPLGISTDRYVLSSKYSYVPNKLINSVTSNNKAYNYYTSKTQTPTTIFSPSDGTPRLSIMSSNGKTEELISELTNSSVEVSDSSSEDESSDEESRTQVDSETKDQVPIDATVYSLLSQGEAAQPFLMLTGLHRPFHNDEQQEEGKSVAEELSRFCTNWNKKKEGESGEEMNMMEQISITSYDLLPFRDINAGIYAKLTVEHVMRYRRKRNSHYSNPWIWRMMASCITEEPSDGLLNTALSPLTHPLGSFNLDLLHCLQPFLSPLSKASLLLPENDPKTLQPLNLVQFCSFDSMHHEPLLPTSSEEYVECLYTPNLLVGYQEQFLSISPGALYLWEKSRLEPYSLKKSVLYHVISPDSSSLSPLSSFFRDLSSVYEVCNFGKHQPLSMNKGDAGGISLLNSKGGANTSQEAYRASLAHFCPALCERIMEIYAEYTEFCCVVIYFMCPTQEEGLYRMIMETYTSIIMEKTSQYPNVNIIFQIIPMETIIKRTDGLSTTKELAFSVYNKIRRISSAEFSNDRGAENRMKLYEPLFIVACSSPTVGIASGQGVQGMKECGGEVQTTPSPLNPLMISSHPSTPMTPSMERETPAESPECVSREKMIHCAYMLGDSETCLVATFTDDRGEILETETIPFFRDDSLSKVLRRLWLTCKLIINLVDHSSSWKFVIAKFGEMSSSELREWEAVINESASDREDSTHQMESIILLSLSFDHCLQLVRDGEDNAFQSFAFYPKFPFQAPHLPEPLAVSCIVTPMALSNDDHSVEMENKTVKIVISVSWTWESSRQQNSSKMIDFQSSVDVQDLLRTITFQYFNLSWLTLFPSTLPS
ncbi:hypothetical protein PROFUN_14976 [Planoprotostelium fungivorum]|uniref:Mediator of RNA polymerase II transcription subunit 13 n=1 Tax=Planoprotostelium fungivorum TaxID=1890364 RepID=A0A2P6MY60_9EUKA|nr:hypothetical protein PROFUN_14976 [Planoprotostelium fungivorum]